MSKTIYGGNPSADNSGNNNNQPVQPVGKGTVILSDNSQASSISPQNPLIGFLISFSRGNAGECWELREGNLYILGKKTDSHIRLNEKSVSDHHASIQIRRSNDEEKRLMIVITDTNSTNGTVVNGKDIGINGHIPLQQHDKILIGNYELAFIQIDREKLQLAPNEKFQEATAQADQPFDYSSQALYNKKTRID
jgi:pSer/pThr/pTyr-binding forkhead associated (FHA) protein